MPPESRVRGDDRGDLAQQPTSHQVPTHGEPTSLLVGQAFVVAGRTNREYSAEGNGGQCEMVFPELDLVVAINCGKYGSPRRYRRGLEVTPKYLIPAAATAR